MSWTQEQGYTPTDFETLMDLVREGVNTQFNTTYTAENFVGTNWYKYFYAYIQKLQLHEIKTSEIFQKLQEFIAITNQRIQRPSVSYPGLIDSFESNGYIASVRENEEEDAGKIAICVDLDDGAPEYPAQRLEVCNLIKDFVAAGMVYEGTEEEEITLSNGQSFTFRFFLPNRIPVMLRLTAVISENNMIAIPTDIQVRQKLFDQINARYRLGWNFEPQRYFTLQDAPWAESVLLEHSINGGADWYATVIDTDFDDLYEFGMEDIQVLIS